MAILIFNVPARTMKRERFALAGVPLLTSRLITRNVGYQFTLTFHMPVR